MDRPDLSLTALPLFHRPAPSPPYVAHNEPSRQAAQAIAPAAGTLRDRVFAVIAGQAHYGCTDAEGCERSGINPSTWRPRRGELEKLGLIRDSGRTRKSSSGRDMTVWAASAAGESHDAAP